MEDAQDDGVYKGRYRSRIVIVRGEHPQFDIRMATNRDLPKLGSSCTTVVIARDSAS
jgi:hypothetical protein